MVKRGKRRMFGWQHDRVDRLRIFNTIRVTGRVNSQRAWEKERRRCVMMLMAQKPTTTIDCLAHRAPLCLRLLLSLHPCHPANYEHAKSTAMTSVSRVSKIYKRKTPLLVKIPEQHRLWTIFVIIIIIIIIITVARQIKGGKRHAEEGQHLNQQLSSSAQRLIYAQAQ